MTNKNELQSNWSTEQLIAISNQLVQKFLPTKPMPANQTYQNTSQMRNSSENQIQPTLPNTTSRELGDRMWP